MYDESYKVKIQLLPENFTLPPRPPSSGSSGGFLSGLLGGILGAQLGKRVVNVVRTRTIKQYQKVESIKFKLLKVEITKREKIKTVKQQLLKKRREKQEKEWMKRELEEGEEWKLQSSREKELLMEDLKRREVQFGRLQEVYGNKLQENILLQKSYLEMQENAKRAAVKAREHWQETLSLKAKLVDQQNNAKIAAGKAREHWERSKTLEENNKKLKEMLDTPDPAIARQRFFMDKRIKAELDRMEKEGTLAKIATARAGQASMKDPKQISTQVNDPKQASTQIPEQQKEEMRKVVKSVDPRVRQALEAQYGSGAYPAIAKEAEKQKMLMRFRMRRMFGKPAESITEEEQRAMMSYREVLDEAKASLRVNFNLGELSSPEYLRYIERSK